MVFRICLGMPVAGSDRGDITRGLGGRNGIAKVQPGVWPALQRGIIAQGAYDISPLQSEVIGGENDRGELKVASQFDHALAACGARRWVRNLAATFTLLPI